MYMKISKLFLFIVLAGCIVSPGKVSALVVFADRPVDPVAQGDSVLIPIYADTEGVEVNSIEGSVIIEGGATVNAITTGGSVFNLWPEKPSLSENVITFAGGTQSGVRGARIRLFTIALVPTEKNNVLIRAKDINGYLADGTGVKISGKTRAVSIPVSGTVTEMKNEFGSLILSDTTPPKKFVIELGRDASQYNGDFFVTFFAEDSETGIQRYEVTEGDFGMVRSGSTYVLRDQTLRTPIQVKAIDMAGNEHVETFEYKALSWTRVALMVGAGLVVIAGVLFLLRKKKILFWK